MKIGAEILIGEIGGKVFSKLFRTKGTNVLYKGKDANGTIRYIGITECEPAIRFAEHLNSGTTRATLKYEVIEGYTKLTSEQTRF